MPRPLQTEPSSPSGWTAREAYLLAMICLLVGLGMGYLLRGPSASAAAAASTPESPSPAGAFSPSPKAEPADADLQAAPLRMELSADPKNFGLLVQLANLYYDKQVFAPAIDYYRRALELRPNDVNVRTDLGTAYWYSGFPQKAIGEYKKSLQIDPGHPQTLFNMGVVYKDGMKDSASAVATWEKLLKLHPDYPDRDRVKEMIGGVRKQTS